MYFTTHTQTTQTVTQTVAKLQQDIHCDYLFTSFVVVFHCGCFYWIIVFVFDRDAFVCCAVKCNYLKAGRWVEKSHSEEFVLFIFLSFFFLAMEKKVLIFSCDPMDREVEEGCIWSQCSVAVDENPGPNYTNCKSNHFPETNNLLSLSVLTHFNWLAAHNSNSVNIVCEPAL